MLDQPPPPPDPLDCDICAELEIIKANTVDILDKTEVIDTKADEIKTALETEVISVSVVRCEQQLVLGKTRWVPVSSSISIEVPKSAAQGFANQLIETAELAKTACNARNDIPDLPEPEPLDCDICDELAIIKTNTVRIESKIDIVDDKTDLIKAETALIKTDTGTIKVAVESRMISVPVVLCQQQTINNVLTWVPVVEQREMSVFKETAEAFEEQMKEIAKLTTAECNARNDKNETPECIAIMPSDLHAEFNIEGRLTLYFVKEEDWPKRTASSSQWSVEVPNPKDNLDWCRDFENFSYQKGNFNCREYWSDSGVRTGAYCASKNEGITFLDWIRTLTKATPLKRRFTESITPRNPLYQGRIKVIRAVRTTIVNGAVTSCTVYSRPANGCQ